MPTIYNLINNLLLIIKSAIIKFSYLSHNSLENLTISRMLARVIIICKINDQFLANWTLLCWRSYDKVTNIKSLCNVNELYIWQRWSLFFSKAYFLLLIFHSCNNEHHVNSSLINLQQKCVLALNISVTTFYHNWNLLRLMYNVICTIN